MSTLRYRALQRYSAARALLALVEASRQQDVPPFSFGPMDLHALERNGLVVTGDDLAVPAAALATVPGVVEVPA